MVRLIRHYLSAFVIALAISGCDENSPGPINVTGQETSAPAKPADIWTQCKNPYTGQGLYAVAMIDGALHVRLKIKFIGEPVTDELFAQYTKGIEDAWSTDRFDIPVVFHAVWTDEDPDWIIQVHHGFGRWSTATWYTHGEVENIVAHEVGHFIGLFDEYGGGDAQGFDGGAAPGPRPAHERGLMKNHNCPVLDYYYDGLLLWFYEGRA